MFSSADGRNSLTWSNRFANLPFANIYNFYSSGEEVLRTHEGPPPLITTAVFDQTVLQATFGTDPAGTFAWAWQEKMKGTCPGDWILGSSHGGWKFNDSYDTNSAHLSAAQAALLPDSELQTNAFFNFASGLFTSDLALEEPGGDTYAQANRNRILADAIPALTLAIGANAVSGLNQPGDLHNFDMQALYENGWPLFRPSRTVGAAAPGEWHHSDLREVSYTFVHGLFDKLVTTGDLK